VPALRDLPDKFIHQPRRAPADILKKAGVTLGKDYPLPIVDHATAREHAHAAHAPIKNAD
jgi:deoxyribodipyrimidine photo-lyase